jgi:GNAT superfamily N-acetyltransferase
MTTRSLVIRSLEERPDAAGLLAEWFVAEWPEYHRGRSLPDVASQFRLVSDVQHTLIAEIENEVVGMVALRGRWEAAPEIPSPWIGGLFVVPQHRGQGIGKALVEAATAEAVAAGQPIVHMAIRVDPESYIRRGWRVVGTVFSGDESVTVLRLETGS